MTTKNGTKKARAWRKHNRAKFEAYQDIQREQAAREKQRAARKQTP